MTGTDDPTETLLEQSLTRNAAQAPGDDRLLAEVHERIGRRRRTVRAVGGTVLAAAAVLAVVTATSTARDLGRPDHAAGTASSSNTPYNTPTTATGLVEGWRWESYGTVQVQVPPTWGYAGEPSQPCAAKPGDGPFVSRPGLTTMLGCVNKVPDLDARYAYVAFAEYEAGVQTFDHGWVRDTRTIGRMAVTVFTDDPALLERIFSTARPIGPADVNGCAPSHPAATTPTTRARSAGGLGTVGEVRSVSVCGYSLRHGDGGLLHSGRTLTATTAAGLVDAIRSAPSGSGPNEPDDCAPDERGDRLYVLMVRGTAHDQEVVVRYSGCRDNGTDDGVTERQLAAGVLRPLLAGVGQNGGMTVSVHNLLR